MVNHLLPPPLVAQAIAMTGGMGFRDSCAPEVGRLLQLLAASRPGARIAETGTGCGVGAAWMATGVDAASRFYTVEQDSRLAGAATTLFAGDERVSVLAGDWKVLAHHAPFDFLFVDGGGKRNDREHAIELVADGGLLVLDDFTPSHEWPPRFQGKVDELRLWWLTHPGSWRPRSPSRR